MLKTKSSSAKSIQDALPFELLEVIIGFSDDLDLTTCILLVSTQMHQLAASHPMWGERLSKDFGVHQKVTEKLNTPEDKKNDSISSEGETKHSTKRNTDAYEVYKRLAHQQKAFASNFRKFSVTYIASGLFYPPLYCRELPETKEQKDTVLQEAANLGNAPLVQWLIDENRGKFQLTPTLDMLNKAARSGNIRLVKFLLTWQGTDGSQLIPTQQTLNCAAHSGNLNLVKLLLGWRGANRPQLIPTQDTLGNGAYSGNLNLVIFLLAWQEADKPQLIPTEETLKWAASSGNLKLLNWLLAWRGADGSQLIPTKKTLDFAARSGNLEVVNRILEYDANLAPDEETFFMAGESGNLELETWLRNWQRPNANVVNANLNIAATQSTLAVYRQIADELLRRGAPSTASALASSMSTSVFSNTGSTNSSSSVQTASSSATTDMQLNSNSQQPSSTTLTLSRSQSKSSE